MPEGAFGLPHTKALPAQPLATANKSEDRMWIQQWVASGMITTVYTAPKSWYATTQTLDTGVSVVMEFHEPIRMTHASIICDNSFMDTHYPGNSAIPVYIAYSHDGVTFTRFEVPGVYRAYQYWETAERDDQGVYFFIPTHDIYAKYWRIEIERDKFDSNWGDGVWHIDSVQPGTTDHIKGVLYDATRRGNEHTHDTLIASLYNDWISNWPSIGMSHTTGFPLDVMLVMNEGYDGIYVNAIFLWMDVASLKAVQHKTIEQSPLKASISILTNTGFVTGTSHATNDWGLNQEYDSSTVPNKGNNYLALGFANKPQVNVAVTRGFIQNGVHENELINTLHQIPDCLIFFDGTDIVGITHPSDPYTLLWADRYKSTAFSTIVMDSEYIHLGASYTDTDAGAILLKEEDGLVTSGTYVGTGATGLVVPTPGSQPKVVMLRKQTGASAVWTSYGGNVIALDGSFDVKPIEFLTNGFVVETTNTDYNDSGVTYLWWAFG